MLYDTLCAQTSVIMGDILHSNDGLTYIGRGLLLIIAYFLKNFAMRRCKNEPK